METIITTKSFDDGIKKYIEELKAKRIEILDAGKDTADFDLPVEADIINDIICGIGVDEDGDYYNNWGVTDNYDSDYPFSCKVKTIYEPDCDIEITILYI